jgi:hypothetical protein
MRSKRLELEPDEKPTEEKAFIRCSVRVCKDNLFGYCQIMPNMDEHGLCISRRDE